MDLIYETAVKTWGCRKMADEVNKTSGGHGVTPARIRQRLQYAEINNPQYLKRLGIYKNDTGWQIPTGLVGDGLFYKEGYIIK